MLRDAQIPLVLWVSTAALLHLGAGQATATAATVLALLAEEREQVQQYAREVREHLKPREVTIALLDDAEALGERPAEAEPAGQQPPEPEQPALDERPPEPSLPEPEPEPEQATQTQPRPPDPPKDSEEPNDRAKKPPPQLFLPPSDGRIAIKQHVPEDQEDNPEASRIADNAHHTDHETMARVRAYDQDSPDPTMGGASTPTDLPEPGNSAEDERGFTVASDEPGPTRPGAAEGSDDPQPPAPPARAQGDPARAAAQAPPTTPSAGRPGQAARPGRAADPGGTGPAAEPGLAAESGEYYLDPSGGDGLPPSPAEPPALPRRGIRGIPGPMRFGGRGPHNLTMPGLVDAVGAERLRAEQERARNARLSKHRGSMSGTDFQRYRAAIENYDPSVALGNQTSLNAARVPFASFINRMHNRIHPIFADTFLRSLDKLAADHPLNRKLIARAEIALDKDNGRVLRMGIVKPSGVTAFDIAALKSIEQAAPFGKAPAVIVSPDGRVYVHWSFNRDPYYACTSRFAQPFILKRPPCQRPPRRPRRQPRTSAKARHPRARATSRGSRRRGQGGRRACLLALAFRSRALINADVRPPFGTEAAQLRSGMRSRPWSHNLHYFLLQRGIGNENEAHLRAASPWRRTGSWGRGWL